MKKTVLIILASLLSLAVKAQDFKDFFTIGDNNIELNISNMPNADTRFCVLNAIVNDDNIKYIIDNDRLSVFISPKNDWSSDVFIKYFENIKTKIASDLNNYSKADKDTQGEIFLSWKTNVSQDLFVLLFKLNMIENSEPGFRDGNQTCATSEPFCTSDIITFHVDANPSGACETGPNYDCLSPYTSRRPYWYHMRIRVAGAFTIRMTSQPSVDIDYCCWGPFTDPIEPCPNQLQTVVDCGSSGASTETCNIPASSQVGQYYIMVITKWNQSTATDITFQKVANSGPGETDCSIIEPFLQANTPCVGNSLVLEANVIEGASYTWTGPDNQTHNGRTWTRTNAQLSMAGLYTCHVVAGTSSGDESINVFVLPNVTADFTFPNQCIAGQPIQFTGTETTSPTGHNSDINVRRWNFGDGTTSTSVNPTHTYSNPGDYQVSYTVGVTGGNEGNCEDTETKTVQVRNQFALTVTSNSASFCEDDAVPNLTATPTGGYGNYTYAWTSSPTCQIDYPNSANTTAHPAIGNTTFTCTVSDGHTTLTQSVNVTVNAIPDVTITGPNPPHINYNMSTTLSVPQTAGATYLWTSDPANLIQSGQNTNQITTKNLTVPTTFYVTVSKNGCSDSNEFTIAVGDALFGNVEILGLAEICSGETTTLKINPSGGSEQYTFNWQPSDKIEGSNSLQTVTTKELTSSTTFTCTITDTDSHTYTATAPQIIVNPIPEASAYIEDNGTTYDTYHLLAGNQVYLTMNDIAGATYSWEPAELISGFIDQNHRTARTINLPENDNTKFTATVTTASGCSNEDSLVVKVFKALDNSYITTSATEICEDFEVMLTAHPDGGTGNFSYRWTPEDQCTDPYSQSTMVYPNRYFHSYSCTITDESIDDKANNRIEKSISIAIKDKPTVNHDLIGQTQVVPGIDYMPYIYEYNVNVSSLQGHDVENAEYTWEIYSYYETPNHLDGNASTWMVFPDEDDKNKAYVSIDEEGNALLKCVITTECGSTVTEKFIYTQGYDHGVSVDEISYDKMISVFPNPSNGELYIGYNDILVTSPLMIRIYSYNGLLIDQIYGEMSSNVTHYSMDGLANGLYLVQVTGDDFVVTKKFVLNR